MNVYIVGRYEVDNGASSPTTENALKVACWRAKDASLMTLMAFD